MKTKIATNLWKIMIEIFSSKFIWIKSISSINLKYVSNRNLSNYNNKQIINRKIWKIIGINKKSATTLTKTVLFQLLNTFIPLIQNRLICCDQVRKLIVFLLSGDRFFLFNIMCRRSFLLIRDIVSRDMWQEKE